MKKWRCTVCGEIVESDVRPDKCPLCKQPGEKFEEIVEGAEMTWATEHIVGIAKDAPAEIIEGLRANFEGECTEVGMYLAMSRVAAREGYPEIALYWKEAALEEARDDQADHAGDRGGHEEVGDGLPADLADLLDVAHLDHAVHDAQQHQRNDNELQQVDENITERLDVLCGKRAGRFRAHGRPENGADDDTGHQADQDLHAKIHAFLLTH